MLDIRKLNARGSNLVRYQACITTDPVPTTTFLPYQLRRASGLDGSNLNRRQHYSWVEHNPGRNRNMSQPVNSHINLHLIYLRYLHIWFHPCSKDAFSVFVYQKDWWKILHQCFGEGSSTNLWWRIISRAKTLVKDQTPFWNIGEGYPSPNRYAPTPMQIILQNITISIALIFFVVDTKGFFRFNFWFADLFSATLNDWGLLRYSRQVWYQHDVPTNERATKSQNQIKKYRFDVKRVRYTPFSGQI